MLDQATKLRRLVEARGVVEVKPNGGVEVERQGLASVAAGRVSFAPSARPSSHGPPPGAEGARDAVSVLQRDSGVIALQPRRIARAIAITSGKGGVGKSHLAVNLSVALAATGRRVCLIDADLGLANADVLCSVTPRYTLDDVVHGRCRLGEALVHAPGGFQLLPGASGVPRMADLTPERHADLLQRLSILERATDLIVIDTDAGINRNVLTFAAAAHTVLVTVTPEPTSITDGYGVIKALLRRAADVRVEIIVNMCTGAREAADVFERLNRVSKAFLRQPLRFGGFIPEDERVRESVHQRLPFTLLYPKCAASRMVHRLAERCSTLYDHRVEPEREGAGFFARLLRRSMRKK